LNQAVDEEGSRVDLAGDTVSMAWLAEAARGFGWHLTGEQLEQFASYQSLLINWSQRMNLTTILEPRQIQLRHFLDSLTCTIVTGNLNGQHLADVGTGAGFPGLPLKILYPEMKLTLIESATKKCRFLEAVTVKLGLRDVTIVTERAETAGQQAAHRAQYDWATARAVAELRVLMEYLLPLCRLGGHALAQKGSNVQVEQESAGEAIGQLGGARPELHSIQLPGRQETHFLFVVEKVAETPLRFPRRIGIPTKRPL
jgi:16S rRNA (guanine527-N7)-methyltransferase